MQKKSIALNMFVLFLFVALKMKMMPVDKTDVIFRDKEFKFWNTQQNLGYYSLHTQKTKINSKKSKKVFQSPESC